MNKTQLEELKRGLRASDIVPRFTGYPSGTAMVKCPSLSHGAQSGKSPPCHVDYDLNVFFCHSCGAGGSMIDLVGYALMDNYNPDRDVWWAAEKIASEGIRPHSDHQRRAHARKNPEKLVDFSLERCLEWRNNLECEPETISWLEARGCKGWRDFFIGYTATDPSLPSWAHHKITIPHIYRDRVWAVKLRKAPNNSADGPKYVSLKGSRYSAPYNADALLRAPRILVIVETELDAVAVQSITGIPCVAFPAGLSEKSGAAFLLTLVFSEHIILIPDNDAAGRKLVEILIRLVPRIQIFWLDEDCKDPGEYIADVGLLPAKFNQFVGSLTT